MGSAACRGAGPERAMEPESVPLYCLAVMGANPARLWFLAWGIESRRRGGCTAVIDQGRWRRVRGMGRLSGRAWVRDFGQIPKELKTRHFGHAAKGDGPPFWAGCLRGLLLVFPDRSPAGLKARFSGNAAKGDGSPFRTGCLRGVLLVFPDRSPKGLKPRFSGQATEGDGSPFVQVA